MSVSRTDSVTVADGTFDLHVWTPEVGSGPGLVLVQEIFGVGPYIRAVAERLAEAGYVVGAPDLFWRFSPNWQADHSEAGLSESFGKVAQLDIPLAVADLAAAHDHLSSDPGVVGTPGVIGFCLGGTLAWALAGTGAPSVCVSYYGSGVPSMLDLVEQVRIPTLFHFGNDDPYLPGAGVDALSAAIAGHANFSINVEHAGHAFDNHEAPMFWNENAAKAAWTKTMAFLGRELPVG